MSSFYVFLLSLLNGSRSQPITEIAFVGENESFQPQLWVKVTVNPLEPRNNKALIASASILAAITISEPINSEPLKDKLTRKGAKRLVLEGCSNPEVRLFS